MMPIDPPDASADAVCARKDGRTITVCLPARDEAATVGPIVETIRRALVEEVPLVDELLVVDDHSTDDTAAVAAAAGATVIDAATTLPDVAPGPGKGRALWRSLHASHGDIVAWCDADVTNFAPHFVTRLVAPLLDRPDLGLVKAYYERPLGEGGTGGGRVTELTAKPALRLLFPELASIRQPLAGEYAGRRETLEQVPFVGGYGVEIALLIDIAQRFGVDAIAQADLGVRAHRNRPLEELGPQALDVLAVVLARAGVTSAVPDPTGRSGRSSSDHVDELPPLITL